MPQKALDSGIEFGFKTRMSREPPVELTREELEARLLALTAENATLSGENATLTSENAF
jgi:predicted DNA-binding transcriptional regulator YafY